jgi:DNA-binding NtrC family response regulator
MNANLRFLASRMHPRIIAVVALSLVVVILIVGRQSFEATEEVAIKEFNQKQLSIAREISKEIEQYFQSMVWALKAIAHIPGVHRYDENSTRQVLSLEIKELQRFGVSDIGVMDANGILRYNAVDRQLEGTDFSRHKYFTEARRLTSAEFYAIELIEFKGAEAGQIGVSIAVPMFGPVPENGHPDDKFEGVIFCSFNLDNLIQKIISPVSSSTRGHSVLLDGEYNVLWMPDRSFLGKYILDAAADFPSFRQVLEKMNTGASGTGTYPFYKFDETAGKFTEEIEEILIAYMPVRLGEALWSFGIWSPREDVKKLIRSPHLKQLFLVSLIIIVTIVGSAYMIAMVFRYNRSLEKKVEEKTTDLKKSHQRLLTVLDSLDAWVYVSDLETYEILFVNKCIRSLFGNVIGKKCWQVLHKNLSGPCAYCTNNKFLGSEDSPTGVNVRQFQNCISGNWYESRDRVIPWVDGRRVRVEIAADITDRKNVEVELRRAHHEMGTFCRIIKEIGVQQSLKEVGSFLIKELNTILDKHDMMLFVFSDNREILLTLTERETAVIKDPELVQNAVTTLAGIDGITVSPRQVFTPPLIPDYFPAKGRQTIIPFQVLNHADGALVIVCENNCPCEEKELDLIALILEQVSGAIKRAALHEEEIRALQSRLGGTAEFCGIIGKNSKMQIIYKLIEDVAPTDATVLIQGESGTGKELVARAIHRKSPRSNRPFVVINCSAYPTTLLESELFGHEKGAFSGATRLKIGRFEQAHSGTVFLDEIGEIPHSAQIKLLRVIQTHKFERLGGEQTLQVDVRIVAATNRDLLQEVKNGDFREDLFYRLNVIPIHLPPLRERRDDIMLLARYFLRCFASETGAKTQVFSSEVMRLLLDNPWPGNVRELENSIEHAVVLSKGDRIEVSHLPVGLYDYQFTVRSFPDRTFLENEKRLLWEVLEECGWNKTQAALRLGIGRTTLYDKIKKFRISRPAPN